MSDSNEIKEITFVDVEKGKISSFFKKRMEQNGVMIDGEKMGKVAHFLGIPANHSKAQAQTQAQTQSQTQTPSQNADGTDPNRNIREMVSNMLKDYEEILTEEDLMQIPTGTRLKYITYDPEKGIELFRQGGYLRSVKPNCVILAGLYRNVYNKRYRINRQVYDPHNKAQLLYNTRFFVSADEHPRVIREKESGSIPVIMMGGGNLSNSLERSTEPVPEVNAKSIPESQSSSFQRITSQILDAKRKELEDLQKKVENLRMRDLNRAKY